MSTELSWSITGNKQGLRERLPGNEGILLVLNLLAGKSLRFGVLSARAYWTSGFKMVLWCLVMLALRTLCSAPAYATQHKQRTCGFLNALTDIWSVWGGTYELSLWCASSLHPVWKYSSDILQSCMLQWRTLLASSCSPPLCLSRNAHVLQWWSDGEHRRAQFIAETFSDIRRLFFFSLVFLTLAVKKVKLCLFSTGITPVFWGLEVTWGWFFCFTKQYKWKIHTVWFWFFYFGLPVYSGF